nr:hypothetical protein [uncultured Microbacterium sp.]
MTQVLSLTGFLTLFLTRRVLHRGALRLAIVRWTLAAICVAVFVGFCALGVLTLRQLVGDPAMLRPLLRVAGAAVPLWILALFTVVRIMFMKSSELVELTYCFPLTNRARTLGFMLFEALLVGLGVTVILGALVSGALAVGGVAILDDIVTCLVMPAVVSYLLASVYYLSLERVLMRFRLARLRAFLVPVIFGATLIAVYLGVTAQSERVLFAAAGEGEFFAVQLVFADMAAAVGMLPTTLIWLVAVALLVCAVCLVTPHTFEPTRRFVALPRLLGRSEHGAYFDAHLRAIETLTVYGIVLAGSYALLLLDIAIPPLLLIALTVQSVYAYESTIPLRACGPRRHGAPARYLLLLVPQLVGLLLCAVPVALMSALTGVGWVEILTIVGFSASNIIVLTLAGIVFPPEKGNPFSAVVGVITAALVTGTLTLGTNLLGLPSWVSPVSLVVIAVAAAAVSILVMQKIERNERHEMVVQSRRQPRGRSGRGGGSRPRDRGLADVLGRVD